MTHRCPEAPKRGKRRWAFVLVPGLAFGIGLAVAVGAAKSRGEPYGGVYRQEVVRVTAPRSGKLLSIDAAHGTDVKPGDRLATVEDTATADRLGALKRNRATAERLLETATRKAAAELTLRQASLEKDRLETRLRYADLLRARLDVQVRRRALEEGDADRAIPVADGRTTVRPVSVESSSARRRIELADARNHDEVLGAQITLCEDRLAELERAFGALPGQLDRAHEVDRLRADLASLDGAIGQAEKSESYLLLASPAHGRVGVYRRKAGDVVAAGETIVQVFDAERSYVLVTVSLADARRFVPGGRVGVAFEGIASRKPLSGRIVEVTSEAEVDADSAVAPGTLSARVRIAPAGRLWPAVPPGTTALVTPAG